MRIIARNTVMAFREKHPETRASLLHWLQVVKAARWASAGEAQTAFSKAKALNGERVRFEVVEGDYRLIAAFDWKRQIVFVKFLGTHADYDRIDALTVNLF